MGNTSKAHTRTYWQPLLRTVTRAKHRTRPCTRSSLTSWPDGLKRVITTKHTFRGKRLNVKSTWPGRCTEYVINSSPPLPTPNTHRVSQSSCLPLPVLPSRGQVKKHQCVTIFRGAKRT